MDFFYPLFLFHCYIILLGCRNQGVEHADVEASMKSYAQSYKNACRTNAEAKWKFIKDPTNSTLRRDWEKAQIEYGSFKKSKSDSFNKSGDLESGNSTNSYQINIIKNPGDSLLNTTEWTKLVSFSTEAAMPRSSIVNHTDLCGSSNHSCHETEISSAVETFSSTLRLVSEAATANSETSVENYWELLTGYAAGYDKMKTMWKEIESLHKKLVNFVLNRLETKYKGNDPKNNTIPAHLSESLEGSDWISIAEDVQPDQVGFMKNLLDQELQGKKLYKFALKMGHSILQTDPDEDFWKESEFHQTCPTQLVNFYHNGTTRVSTCEQVSLANFLSAHKIMAKVVTSQMNSDDYSIFNTANRYSALNEAVSELFSILSVSPGELMSSNLIDKSTGNQNHNEISSLMITALDVLPRLAYYAAADSWRIDAIKNGTFEPDELLQSWRLYREQYQGVSNNKSFPTFLDDEFITSNKPYLSKFVGTVLAFQLYEYLTGSTNVSYDDVEKYGVKPNLTSMLEKGRADDWIKVLSTYLKINEVNATALTSFFAPLEKYLDHCDSENIPSVTSSPNFIDFNQSTYAPTLLVPLSQPSKDGTEVPSISAAEASVNKAVWVVSFVAMGIVAFLIIAMFVRIYMKRRRQRRANALHSISYSVLLADDPDSQFLTRNTYCKLRIMGSVQESDDL